MPCAKLARPAFTLVEVLAVLLILSLLIGAAGWSAAASRQRLGLEEAAQQWQFQDRLARDHARRWGRPALLVVDLGQGSLQVVNSQNQPQGRPWFLPQNVRIARLLWSGQSLHGGQVALPLGASGASPSYALELVSSQGQSQWMFVAGLTGSWIAISHEEEAQHILGLLPPPGR